MVSRPETISVEAVAELLSISRAVAYQSCKTGKIPVLHFGKKRLRVPVAALEKMLETGVQPSEIQKA